MTIAKLTKEQVSTIMSIQESSFYAFDIIDYKHKFQHLRLKMYYFLHTIGIAQSDEIKGIIHTNAIAAASYALIEVLSQLEKFMSMANIEPKNKNTPIIIRYDEEYIEPEIDKKSIGETSVKKMVSITEVNFESSKMVIPYTDINTKIIRAQLLDQGILSYVVQGILTSKEEKHLILYYADCWLEHYLSQLNEIDK